MQSGAMPVKFVDPDSSTVTYFPLHSLRVSLITYLILDLNIPPVVVSKLIAGHARVIMTLYYTKFGATYMKEVMAGAEAKEFEADQENYRRFLMDASFDQIGRRFASISDDAARTVVNARSAAALIIDDKGICPVGAGLCDVGGARRNESLSRNDFDPVPGYPQERNCVRCRFFLSGPAFLPGLQAHFNLISARIHAQSARYEAVSRELRELEEARLRCEMHGVPFEDQLRLERLSQREETDAERLGKLVNDLQAAYSLIERSIAIANDGSSSDVRLVATGAISDLEAVFIDAHSELHQLQVVCENALIYAHADSNSFAVRRGQLLDGMLIYNRMAPVFLKLTPEQQLHAGNALMQLIQRRAGSFRDALEYGECQSKLKALGLVEKDVVHEIATAGIPIRARNLVGNPGLVRLLPIHQRGGYESG